MEKITYLNNFLGSDQAREVDIPSAYMVVIEDKFNLIMSEAMR